jgi:death on curing protein
VIRYVSLPEYLWLAEQITGLDAATLGKIGAPDLADSALHAPQAGFGDEDFYPSFVDKASILVCRLTWNHPLPDGNKRTAWATLRTFIELNSHIAIWAHDPTVDQAEALMVGIAGGELDENDVSRWLSLCLVVSD